MKRARWQETAPCGVCKNGRLLLALAATLCLMAGFAQRASVAAETLQPALTLPKVGDVSADEYYILLLKWARNVVIKPVTAHVVYLDPPLYLAWLKQTNPDVTEAQLAKVLTGFPHVLRFRIDYRAASRKLLAATSWKAELIEPNGRRVVQHSGRRVQPASLESNDQGTYWEEQWEYAFDVPASFLNAHTTGFGIALDGPAGSGTARWQFGAVRVEASHPDAYVPYLGSALLLFSGVVAAALVLTRRPRRGLS